jgi:hypothetical protein
MERVDPEKLALYKQQTGFEAKAEAERSNKKNSNEKKKT